MAAKKKMDLKKWVNTRKETQHWSATAKNDFAKDLKKYLGTFSFMTLSSQQSEARVKYGRFNC